MKYLRVRAIGAIAMLSIPVSVHAQGAAGAATAAAPVAAVAPAVAAPAAASSVAGPTTLWRFLGIPQTAKALRNGLVNRRGNFPGLERKPPLVPIGALENLESPNPAIKAAAEIKQAEDMKKQKIKAIKYLATIGCGCYDKDGKVTDALLAGTDDCTPDVRLAVVEAIEDNVNNDCCKRCGTKSCCNEKTSKRLSEMAYERDDSGCHLEPSAEIRRAAARVLKKCCPGGPPSGPIEEDYEAREPAELIPAPEPDKKSPKEPKVKGESRDNDESIKGETSDGDDTDSLELKDNPFNDEKPKDSDAPKSDAEDLILRRATNRHPVELSLADLQPLTSPSDLAPVVIEPIESQITVVSEDFAPVVVRPQGRLHLAKPALAKQSTLVPAPVHQLAPQPLEFTAPVSAQPAAIRLRTPDRSTEIAEQSHVSSLNARNTRDVTTPRYRAVSEVAFVNYQTGEVLLKGGQLKNLQTGTIGDIYRTTASGTVKIGQLNVRVIGRSTAQADVDNSEVLRNIRMGDQVICP